MAESKRSGRKPSRLAASFGRLSPLNLAANALAAFAAAPALFVLAAMFWLGQLGDEASRSRNEHLFLGAVCALIGVFLLVLSGLKVREHLAARKRFRELLEGEKKSLIAQNLDELTSLARSLGPPYRKRLEGRLAEMGIRR